MHSLFAPIDSAGLCRRQVERALRRPRLEWDSLSRCMIPVALPSDREPADLARGDVMLSGPWSFRGDLHELRESDRHERLRRAVLAALGYYDHDQPEWDAPGYAYRRRRAEQLLCLGIGGASLSAASLAPPKRQPWQFTAAGRCYDAGFGVTGSPVTGWANSGADGATYDATSSGTLSVTSGWSGALSAIASDGSANNFFQCGGAASNWRVHGAATPWTVVVCGRNGSAAAAAFAANRANQSPATTVGFSIGFTGGLGEDFRIRTTNSTPAQVLSPGMEGAIPDGYQAALIAGARIAVSTGNGNLVGRSALQAQSASQSALNPPSDVDANAMFLMCCSNGTTGRMTGELALAIFHQLDSAGYLQSTVDHCRALARL